MIIFIWPDPVTGLRDYKPCAVIGIIRREIPNSGHPKFKFNPLATAMAKAFGHFCVWPSKSHRLKTSSIKSFGHQQWKLRLKRTVATIGQGLVGFFRSTKVNSRNAP